MSRIPPVFGNQAPGNFMTSALWNAQVGGLNSFAFTPPVFKAYSTVTTSVPNSSTPTVGLDTVVRDSDGGHSTITNPSRYTIQVAGLYVAVGSLSFPNASDGTRRGVAILQNGALVKNVAYPPDVTNTWSGQCTEFLVCAVGDYIELGAISGATTAQNLVVGTVSSDPTLCLYWISE